jgi:hypothetical protein
MKMRKIKKEELAFEHNHRGFQILFRGNRIGGAGTITESNPRHREKNSKLHRQIAELTIRDIMEGKIQPFMKTNIEKIQRTKNV